jgi:hypothetical protein
VSVYSAVRTCTQPECTVPDGFLLDQPKRSGKGVFKVFEREARHYYPTPPSAVLPLLPHLPMRTSWCEPCAGNGALIDAIGSGCVYACDVEPQVGAWDGAIEQRDCLTLTEADCHQYGIEVFVTNPPWPLPGKGGEPATGIIRHLMMLRPSWFLLPADFMHNGYAASLLGHCERIVSVGRVKWMPDSKMTGTDNVVWMKFVPAMDQRTRFFGRGFCREDRSQV